MLNDTVATALNRYLDAGSQSRTVVERPDAAGQVGVERVIEFSTAQEALGMLTAIADAVNGRFQLARSTGPGTHWVCRLRLPGVGPGAVARHPLTDAEFPVPSTAACDVERYADGWRAAVVAVLQGYVGSREGWQG